MRLESKFLSFIVNFLLGTAWAAVLLGAVSSFLSMYQDSLFFAIVYAIMGALPGMVVVLLLEHFISSKEKQFELEKQTKILEQLLMQKNKNDVQDYKY